MQYVVKKILLFDCVYNKFVGPGFILFHIKKVGFLLSNFNMKRYKYYVEMVSKNIYLNRQDSYPSRKHSNIHTYFEYFFDGIAIRNSKIIFIEKIFFLIIFLHKMSK